VQPLGIGQQAREGVAQRRAVARRDADAVVGRFEHRARAGQVGHHGREPARHRLDQREAQPFGERGADVDPMALQQRRQRRPVVGLDHVELPAHGGRVRGHDVRRGRARAEERDPEIGSLLEERGERLGELAHALARRVAADAGDPRSAVRARRRRQPGERLRDAVADEPRPLARHAQLADRPFAILGVEEQADVRAAHVRRVLREPHAAVVDARPQRDRAAALGRLAHLGVPERVGEPVRAARHEARAAQDAADAVPDPGVAGRRVDHVVAPPQRAPRHVHGEEQLLRLLGQPRRQVVERGDLGRGAGAAERVAQRDRHARRAGPGVERVVDRQQDPHARARGGHGGDECSRRVIDWPPCQHQR
jgi:hypothetical protein